MVQMTTQELLAQVNANVKASSEQLKVLAENAMTEAQKSGTLSAETKTKVDQLLTDTNLIRQAQNNLEVRLGEAEQLYARLPTGGAHATKQDIGEIVLNNEAVLDLLAAKEGGRRAAVPVNIRNALTTFGTKVDGTSQIIAGPEPRLHVRDLIMPGQTANNTVYYIKETGFTNNAAAVAENAAKPYSEITLAEVNSAVRTIAHLLKQSKQIMDDLPQLQSFINGRLMTGLKRVEDFQLLFGSGTGQNLNGIFTQATAYAAPITVADPTWVDILRLAMLQAELADLPATGHALHRSDWAAIELTKDLEGRYLFANPMANTTPMMWGLPVAETNHSAMLGKFLTGSFAQGAQIFDREDANIIISTENSDDFEKNMISIRCEERLALAVYRPEAFIKGTFPV